MQENENTQAVDFLLPGHVWVHRKRKTPAVVISLTNTHLSEKFAEAYPPSVTYVDTNGNFTSATIEQFIKSRDFDHVEPRIESAVEALRRALYGDDEDTELKLDDDEDDVVVNENAAETAGADVTEVAVEDPEYVTDSEAPASIELELVTSTDEALPVVHAEILQAHCLTYAARPTIAGDELHELEFRLSEELTHAQIYTAFSSDIVRYSGFSVAGIDVAWDEFLGVYPRVTGRGVAAVAVFAALAEASTVLEIAPAVKKAAPAKAPTKSAAPAKKPAPVKTAAPTKTAAPVKVAAPAKTETESNVDASTQTGGETPAV